MHISLFLNVVCVDRHGVEVHKDVRSAMSNIKGWFTEDSMEKMLFGAQAETTAMMPK